MSNIQQVHMHWTTRIGVAGVALLALVIAALNVAGWYHTLPGWAGIAAGLVAFCFEVMAFVLWETIRSHVKSRRLWSSLAAILGLFLAVALNVEGGHRGLNFMAGPLYQAADNERRVAQAALDASRASIQNEIAERQARIESAAATNPGETYPGRMEQWRLTFETLTADDRSQIETLRRQLENKPVVVEASAPFPAGAPYAVAFVFVFFSVFGLTLFGVKIPGPELSVKAPAGPNVVDFGTARDARDADRRDADTVRRLRKQNISFRDIEEQTGISKSRAQRLSKAS